MSAIGTDLQSAIEIATDYAEAALEHCQHVLDELRSVTTMIENLPTQEEPA